MRLRIIDISINRRPNNRHFSGFREVSLFLFSHEKADEAKGEARKNFQEKRSISRCTKTWTLFQKEKSKWSILEED